MGYTKPNVGKKKSTKVGSVYFNLKKGSGQEEYQALEEACTTLKTLGVMANVSLKKNEQDEGFSMKFVGFFSDYKKDYVEGDSQADMNLQVKKAMQADEAPAFKKKTTWTPAAKPVAKPIRKPVEEDEDEEDTIPSFG